MSGRVGKPTGLSQAEPSSTVSALTGFDPSRDAAFVWSRLGLAIERVGRAISRIDNDLGYQGSAYILSSDNLKISDVSLILSAASALRASAIEARRAETVEQGSVHESAVPNGETPPCR